MVAPLAALAMKVKAGGFAKAAKGMKGMGKSFKKMHQSMAPRLENLKKKFGQFGVIAAGAFAMFLRASPRLQAEMSILDLRTKEFFRTFGDYLAPAIRTVSDLIKKLTANFRALPEPLQEAIKFAAAFMVGLGLLAGIVAGLSILLSPIAAVFIGMALGLATLKLAWDSNFAGIQDTVKGLMTTVKPLFESLGTIISNVGEILGQLWTDASPILIFLEDGFKASFQLIIDIIAGVVKAIGGLFSAVASLTSGDIGGAITGLQTMFKEGFGAIAGFITLPFEAAATWIGTFLRSNLLGDIIKGIGGIATGIGTIITGVITGIKTFINNVVTTITAGVTLIIAGVIKKVGGFFTAIGASVATGISNLGTFFTNAGKELIGNFIKAAQKAIVDAGGILTDILGLIGEFFGGSLPERGPLKNISHWGKDLGVEYVRSIGVGVNQGSQNIMNRTFNIDTIAMTMDGADRESTGSFLNAFDDDMRRATGF